MAHTRLARWGPHCSCGPFSLLGTVALVSFNHYSNRLVGEGTLATTALAGDECKWTYQGNLGPSNWAKLCNRKFELCEGGPTSKQSPIDIVESQIEKVNDGFTETIGWVLPPDSYANFLKGGGGYLLESYTGHVLGSTFRVPFPPCIP